jgi:DNA-binding MarR family transcriptional regulator
MNTKYRISLTDEEINTLESMICNEAFTPNQQTRALILLKRNLGHTYPEITKTLEITPSTIASAVRQYSQGGIAKAIRGNPPGHMDEWKRKRLFTLMSSSPPAPHEHWTLRMLADRAECSITTVSKILKRNSCKHF